MLTQSRNTSISQTDLPTNNNTTAAFIYNEEYEKITQLDFVKRHFYDIDEPFKVEDAFRLLKNRPLAMIKLELTALKQDDMELIAENGVSITHDHFCEAFDKLENFIAVPKRTR